MTSPSDQLLAEQVRQGNEQAFVHLIRRYERTLAGLIRHRVGPSDQVQDVLQETLVHAWSGLRRDTPRDVRAWLLQVARNRCRDYFRSTQRRELFVETEVLTPMVNRFGVAQARQREAAADIVEAMEEIPDHERAALRAFYLDGLSIAEIAARHRCPNGTVKRRLSHGRDRIRTVLGVTSKKRSKTMSTSQQRPFPQYRPEIRIEASQEAPFRIDFKEMAWWFIVPEVGDRVRYASYGPPQKSDAPWRLSETVSLAAQRPAIIHDRPCVEVEVENQHLTAMTGDNMPNEKKNVRVKVWGHMAENAVEWIAVESLRPDGTRELMTFLDEGFYDDWDPSPRLIEDRDCLRPQADGSFARQADDAQITGAG
ncbi:MAG: RNA polymerase sigma factor, partial [Gemmatimonadota bacterium]|nr:RNA polymerase sigma factor [Gemmatimonadota bacterium]